MLRVQQKERLRHLMSSAILELWKKETGSGTSVTIDATICITPRNGRTTIIQVCDEFQSSLPEGDDLYTDDISTNHNESLNGNVAKTYPLPSLWKTFTSNGRPSSSATPIETLQSSPTNYRRASATTPVRSSPIHQNNNKNQLLVTKIKNNSKKLNKTRITPIKSSVRKGEENGGHQSAGNKSIQSNSISLLQSTQYLNNVHAAKDDNNNNETGGFNAELSSLQREEFKDQDIKIETTSDDEDDDDDDDSSSDLDLDDSICLNTTRTPDRSRDGSSIVHNFSKPLVGHDLRQTIEGVKERNDRVISSDRENDHDDSAIQDMSIDLSYSEINSLRNGPSGASTTRNADRHKARTAVVPKTPTADLMNVGRIAGGKYTRLIFGTDVSSPSVVDLSAQQQRDSDLSISSPQSYTAQVRDAIRRRLLATNQPVVSSLFSPPLVNGHRVLNAPSLGATKMDFTPPSPVGVSPISTDALKKVRDSPYSRSLSLNGATSILWGRPIIPPGFVGIKQQDSVQNNSASVSGQPVDLNFFLPFSAAQIESKTGGSTSNGMLPPHSYMTSSQVNNHQLALNQAKHAAMARASLHNILAGMPGGEALQDSGAGAQQQAVDDKQGGQNEVSGVNDLDGSLSSGGGELQGGDQQSIYRCDYCSKTFLFKSKYHEHLPVHTSARPFQCHMCSRTYKYKYDLRVHLRTHLGIPTKSTVCPFCTDKFGTNKLLRAHIRDMHREQQQIGEKQRAISLEGMMALGGSPHIESAADSGSRGEHGLDNYIGNGNESLIMDLDLDVKNAEYSTKNLDVAVGTPSTSAEDLSIDGSSRSAPDHELTVDRDSITSNELTPPQLLLA